MSILKVWEIIKKQFKKEKNRKIKTKGDNNIVIMADKSNVINISNKEKR